MRWRVGLSTTLAMLFAAVPAQAQLPELAGVNQMSGDRSGYLDIRIPEPVRMSFDSRPSSNFTFAINSKGFAGVMLRRLGAGENLGTVIAAARFEPGMLCGGCEAPVETLTVGIEGIEPQASTDYAWQIPAGDYRLYLLTDGRPADVRITLPERNGSRVLRPEHGVENPVPNAIPSLSAIPAGPYNSFGRGDLFPSPGVQLWGGMVYLSETGSVEIYGCSHEGGDPVNTIFTPGCPGGSAEGSYGFTYLMTPDATHYGAGFIAERDAGDWSVGGSVAAAGDIRAVGWASVVLPYKGDGTRLTPAANRPGDPASPPGPAAALQTENAAPAQPAGRARLLTRSARVRRGRVDVRIGCSGGGNCTGSIRVGRARASRFSVIAGRSASVRLAVPRALARQVRRRGRAAVQVALGDEPQRLTLRR